MKNIEIRPVRDWDTGEILQLYRAGGWWKEEWEPEDIRHLVSGSFVFGVGIDHTTGKAIAMGRVISDGVSDAYIQDLVVLPEYRHLGIGHSLLSALVSICRDRGITWIGLIAEPGTGKFYTPAGFSKMEGYIPMLYSGTGGGDGAFQE
jgi:aralkylamine N-acetyltransferase